MKDKKKIKKIAQQIVILEQDCSLHKNNINKNVEKMQKLTENLSLEELLAIDEYIMKNHLLTK